MFTTPFQRCAWEYFPCTLQNWEMALVSFKVKSDTNHCNNSHLFSSRLLPDWAYSFYKHTESSWILQAHHTPQTIKALLLLMSHITAENYTKPSREMDSPSESSREWLHLSSLGFWWWSRNPVPRMSTGRYTKPLNNLPDPFLMDDTGKNSHVSLWFKGHPAPRKTKHLTTTSWVTSLSSLLMAQGENEVALSCCTCRPFPRAHSRLSGQSKEKTSRVFFASKKALLNVNSLLIAAVVGVLQQSTAAEEITTAIQREKSFCKGKKKKTKLMNIHNFPSKVSSSHRLSSAD